MERDFLGVGGNDSLVKEEAWDSASIGGPGVQWPFSNKMYALHHFMSFKAAQEERPRKIVYDQFSSSGFHPVSNVEVYDSIHKSSPDLASQKSSIVDRQGIHQFFLPGYQSQGADSFVSSSHQSNEARMFPMVSHHSIPIATSSPFFKVNGLASGSNPAVFSLNQQTSFGGGIAMTTPVVGSSAGDFAPRNTSKPSATTQLTIFYQGAVNVYDDVPLEKAQAIMFLAGNGSNTTTNMGNARAEAPVLAPAKTGGVEAINMNQTLTQAHGTPPCSGLSSSLSVTSHSVAQTGGGSITTDDMMGAKAIAPLITPSHHEPLKTVDIAAASSAGVSLIPTAVPQARKASLARFLEKRKERVTYAAPYASSQKPPESTGGFDGVNLSASSLTGEVVALSSSREKTWCLSKPKNSADSYMFPSTKLEI